MANDNLNWSSNQQPTRPTQQGSQPPRQQQPTRPRHPTTPPQQQPMRPRQPTPPMQQQQMMPEFPDTPRLDISGQDLGIPPMSRQGPPPVMERYYVPGYLQTLIGQVVRAEFIINNIFMDKTGVLEEVGVNYFVLNDLSLGHRVMCDLYSARFVTSMGESIGPMGQL